MISFVRPTHRVLGRLGSLLMVLALLVLFVLPAAAYEAGAPDGPAKLIAQPVTSGPGQPIKLEVAEIEYGPGATIAARSHHPEASAFAYDNTINFLGQAFVNGGAAVQTGNTITRLAADDITVGTGFAGQNVRRFEFSVANLNATTVSARACAFLSGQRGSAGDVYYRPFLQPNLVCFWRWRILLLQRDESLRHPCQRYHLGRHHFR